MVFNFLNSDDAAVTWISCIKYHNITSFNFFLDEQAKG